MTPKFIDLDCLDKYTCFDQYIRATFTGEYLLDTLATGRKVHITDQKLADTLNLRFAQGILMIAHETEVVAALQEEHGRVTPEALRVGLVNDAIFHTCENIYSKMHDKITQKNSGKTLKKIQDDYLNAKSSFIDSDR